MSSPRQQTVVLDFDAFVAPGVILGSGHPVTEQVVQQELDLGPAEASLVGGSAAFHQSGHWNQHPEGIVRFNTDNLEVVRLHSAVFLQHQHHPESLARTELFGGLPDHVRVNNVAKQWLLDNKAPLEALNTLVALFTAFQVHKQLFALGVEAKNLSVGIIDQLANLRANPAHKHHGWHRHILHREMDLNNGRFLQVHAAHAGVFTLLVAMPTVGTVSWR